MLCSAPNLYQSNGKYSFHCKRDACHACYIERKVSNDSITDIIKCGKKGVSITDITLYHPYTCNVHWKDML